MIPENLEYQELSEREGQNSDATIFIKETETSPNIDEAPDGGLRAWLVAAGGFCIWFSGLGFANSFGVFQEYFMTHQLRGKSPANIAWIGSLSAFLQLAIAVIAGPLFDRHGAWIIRPAAILFVFGVMMLSLCSEYWQFMLTQGVLIGTSMGFLMFPCIAALSQYFDKKRAAAMGVAVSGSSVGGIVFPIAFSKLLNESSLGFGWTVRVMGFVMLPLLIFSCVAITARLPPRTTTFFIGLAFKELTFVLMIVSLFFMFLGMWTPLFFIPTYAVSRGVDAALASYLLAIVNGASTFGRIIPGILADRYGKLNMFGLGGIMTGVVILCMNKAETTAALVVYSIAFGFTSGTIVSGAAAAFSVCTKDPRDVGTYMGMGMAIASLAVLIGPPVNGALVAKYGEFLELTIFSGVMCLVGGFIAIASKAATPEGLMGNR
ncbi:monocarboxylate permease-like protein [Mytilinidion resinicola]|uniref:Monocarboxylate permease-like protein n=1 Tax=Mytilinidion resinicola TaxID=574789 RepID=A0A6A6YSM4_9PEZI|nr:monocarboxylate permease-like protein [Mytilinidion resinicola]KAF2811946.1 monocarboxylate permease-like protein [Mytilinidion resinicola]